MSDFYRIRQSADFVLSTLSCQYGIFLFDEQACVVDLRQSSAAVECDVNRRLHDIGHSICYLFTTAVVRRVQISPFSFVNDVDYY